MRPGGHRVTLPLDIATIAPERRQAYDHQPMAQEDILKALDTRIAAIEAQLRAHRDGKDAYLDEQRQRTVEERLAALEVQAHQTWDLLLTTALYVVEQSRINFVNEQRAELHLDGLKRLERFVTALGVDVPSGNA
jgi:hypothetical protein